MYISVVRLYHPAPWGFLYSYRAGLVAVRMLELGFIVMRYMLFRAPLLVVWTRLPGLRDIRPPYGTLGEVMAPTKQRASLAVSGGQLGGDLSLIESVPEAAALMSAFQAQVKPPSRFWTVFGCVLRGLFTDMGIAFIKLGQILSMKEEVPSVIKRELALLQDKLPAMSYKEVNSILERELNQPVMEVFEYVEKTPIASGALAQVHRAKLRKEQEEVALKIQRPHLEGTVALDTVIVCDIFFGALEILLPLLRKSTDTGIFTTSYRESLEKEIDFVFEERSQSTFRRLIMEHPIYRECFKIARTYPAYTTGKLLTMELVKNYHRLDRIMDELTPQQLLEFGTTQVKGFPPEAPIQLVVSVMKMNIESIMQWPLTHGDFHLGNLYALEPEKEGDNWKIFLCDFGMMMENTPAVKDMCKTCVAGMAYYNSGEVVATQLTSISTRKLSPKQSEKLRNAFELRLKKYATWTDLGERGERAFNITIQRGSPTNAISEMLYAAALQGLKLEPFAWPFFKNLCYQTSVGSMLSTEISGTQLMVEYISKWMKDRIMAELDTKDVSSIRDSVPEILHWLRPYDRNEVMKALATGEKPKPKEKSWVRGWRDVLYDTKQGL